MWKKVQPTLSYHWSRQKKKKKSSAPPETGHRHLSEHIKQFVNWCENPHTNFEAMHVQTQTRMRTLSHLNVNTHTDVKGTPWRHCLLTCYLGSKRQQLEGEKSGRAIICWGKKLQPSVVFVLRQTWQKKRFPQFHKNEGIFLFPSHHHVRDSLKYSEYFLKKIKAGRKWITASLVI